MSKIQVDNAHDAGQQWQHLTLWQYVRLRNGVPPGDAKSLRNMLHRALGAASFAGFWQHWNPIWGYGLGKFVYSPLRRTSPPAAAFIMTFIVSGAIHDLATNQSIASLYYPLVFLARCRGCYGPGVWYGFSATAVVGAGQH